MAKNLDGIKKLNPADIQKNRKIVLNYIGEKDPAEVGEVNNFKQEIPSLKRVDGINFNKINRLAAKGKKRFKKFFDKSIISLRTPPPLQAAEPSGPGPEQTSRKDILEEKKEEAAKASELEAARLREAIKKQEEERKKIKAEETLYQIKKSQAEEDKKFKEKERLENLEKEEKRRIEENLSLEKMKRAQEMKIIEQAAKMKKQAARQKKRIKRQKAWRKTKINFIFKLNNVFAKVKKNIVYLVSFSVLFLIMAYLVLCLAALRLKTNNFVDWAANYLPVPAVITSQRIISYLDYKKIEDKNYLSLSLAEKESYLIKWAVLRDLRKKYELSADASYDQLAIRFVLDKNFNQVGQSRINKISELLKAQNEVVELNKYADEYDDGAYYDSKSAAEKFGPGVLELAIGQTSQIIPRFNGYYIVKKIDNKNGQLGFKYLFVEAQTLNQYLKEKSEKVKVFILAD